MTARYRLGAGFQPALAALKGRPYASGERVTL
jgi:hypothetical protein